MTKKEQREYLGTALEIFEEIARLTDSHIDFVNWSAKEITYDDRVKTYNTGLSGQDLASELQDEIKQKQIEWKKEGENIENAINDNLLLSKLEKKILILRYVRCLPWKNVSSLAGYSKTHCHRIERSGLNKLCSE